MPEQTEIRIEGLDELIRKLDSIKQLKTVHAGLKAGAVYLMGKLKIYPPPTAANMPGNPSGRWYERGFGWIFASGRRLKVSEDLAGKWTINYNPSKFEAVIGNNASYARFVQGPAGVQARHMKQIGWEGVDVIAERETRRVTEYVAEAVRRAIEG